MKKYTNFISILMVTILFVFISLKSETSINGLTILLLLCLLINPIKNVYSNKKIVIESAFYNVLLLLNSLLILFILIKSLYIYYDTSMNNATLYFFNFLIYLLPSTSVILTLSFLFKKEVVTQELNYKYMFIAVAVTSLLLIINDVSPITTVIGLCLCLFSIVMLFNMHNKDFKKILILLIILSITTYNVVALVLLISMYQDNSLKTKEEL